MRRRVQPFAAGRLAGLGAFSVDDSQSYPPNAVPGMPDRIYSESAVFNSSGRRGSVTTIAAPQPGSVSLPNVGRFSLTPVGDTLLVANTSKVILNINPGRVYFFIQNLGPGNLRVRFGDSVALSTNSLILVVQQFLEYLGGANGQGVFVPQDIVSVSADTASTNYIYGEGNVVGV